MGLLLILSTFGLLMGTLWQMFGLKLIRPYKALRFAAWAFLLCAVASVGWCATDLTTTVQTILGFDIHNLSSQSVAGILVAIGTLVVSWFGARPVEAFLEHWVMDHVPGGARIKMLVPAAISLAIALVMSLATGASWQVAVTGALLMWSKSQEIHASDAGSVSADAEKKALASVNRP